MPETETDAHPKRHKKCVPRWFWRDHEASASPVESMRHSWMWRCLYHTELRVRQAGQLLQSCKKESQKFSSGAREGRNKDLPRIRVVEFWIDNADGMIHIVFVGLFTETLMSSARLQKLAEIVFTTDILIGVEWKKIEESIHNKSFQRKFDYSNANKLNESWPKFIVNTQNLSGKSRGAGNRLRLYSIKADDQRCHIESNVTNVFGIEKWTGSAKVMVELSIWIWMSNSFFVSFLQRGDGNLHRFEWRDRELVLAARDSNAGIFMRDGDRARIQVKRQAMWQLVFYCSIRYLLSSPYVR